MAFASSIVYDFYPRPPRGGRPSGSTSNGLWGNFYPRPPRGGRLDFYYPVFANLGISIHALREEGDSGFGRFCCCIFSFLSTPSARRATWRNCKTSC